MTIKVNGPCEYKDCKAKATQLAYNRHTEELGHYCTLHATAIADIGVPEYIVNCPHCKCRFGVN